MGHQGHKTGGRHRGIPNKRTLARFEAAAEVVKAVGAVIPDAFAGDAHLLVKERGSIFQKVEKIEKVEKVRGTPRT